MESAQTGDDGLSSETRKDGPTETGWGPLGEFCQVLGFQREVLQGHGRDHLDFVESVALEKVNEESCKVVLSGELDSGGFLIENERDPS